MSPVAIGQWSLSVPCRVAPSIITAAHSTAGQLAFLRVSKVRGSKKGRATWKPERACNWILEMTPHQFLPCFLSEKWVTRPGPCPHSTGVDYIHGQYGRSLSQGCLPPCVTWLSHLWGPATRSKHCFLLKGSAGYFQYVNFVGLGICAGV